MQYRKFGQSEILVSKIGHGTWGMGGMWGPREDHTAIAALIRGLELGINFIDTAAVYGNGHSEELIASALKKHKAKDVFIASKVPPLNRQWPAREKNVSLVFPKEHIISETEKSLKNLRRDYLDLQQLHVWQDDWLKTPEFLEAVDTLKTQGKIKCFGISINDHDPNSAIQAVESGLIDSVQVIYNIFDQTPENKLFPTCEKHNVAVIVRVPFDEGSLTGKLTPNTEFHKKDWRKYYFTKARLEETCTRVESLKHLLDENSPDLPSLALQFCLSHPSVTTVIPGMRTLSHVESNCRISDLPKLTSEKREQLKIFSWPRNYYPSHG